MRKTINKACVMAASLSIAQTLLQAQASPAAHVLRVTATEYAFTISAPPKAGLITVRLVNHGREMHHLEISPVADNLSLREYYDKALAGAVTDVGGPNMTAPGDSSEAIIRLAAGRYIITCWVKAADGKEHIMHGMMGEMRLAPSPKQSSDPAATVSVTASDYAFAIRGKLHAGVNVVSFENNGPQEHDIQFVRLAPGQDLKSISDWSTKGGVGSPTPAVAGGSSGIVKGRQTWFTLNLQSGRYAIFCFVPDSKGKMHLLHGMLKEVNI